MTSVLQELEQLRAILDQPAMYSVPHAQPRAAIAPYQPSYPQQPLNVAERGVDRLGRAIEAAEEEMENALRRTTEVHKSQLRQKEVELSETQRLLTAKERSIDSLRDTLATTKRTYEARLAQTESALSLKEAEVIALSEEVRVSHMERDNLNAQLQKLSTQAGRELDEMHGREAVLMADVRNKGDEAARTAVALRAERQDVLRHQSEMEELRRQVQLMGDELRVVRVESRAERERLESQVELLRQRLRTERGVRKACEKWLRSELKSREEMDVLLSAIREAASGKAPLMLGDCGSAFLGAGMGGRELSPDHEDDALLLLDALRVYEQHAGGIAATKRVGSGQRGGTAGALRAGASHQAVMHLEAQSRQIVEENRRLQADLQSARRLLTEKLLK